MADHLKLILEPSEEEDGGPEEVTFEAAKTAALRRDTEAAETSKREKQQLKDMRRKRHELFQEQKKRRLLPDDVLEEVEAAPAQAQEEDGEQGEEESGEEDDDEGVGSEEETDASGKIRMLQGGYTVRTVDECSLAASQQRAASDFLQEHLCGPGSRRTTNQELLSLRNKRAERKVPSAEFVKKGWAPKHRAKAERLKQRWIQKQQAS